MTVASNVKQTLAGLKGARATLATMAAIEKHPDNKALLDRHVERIAEVVAALEQRVGALEYEEPQYRGF